MSSLSASLKPVAEGYIDRTCGEMDAYIKPRELHFWRHPFKIRVSLSCLAVDIGRN